MIYQPNTTFQIYQLAKGNVTNCLSFMTSHELFSFNVLFNSLTRNFKMRSTAPIEFEYMIEIIQIHPAFRIEPLEGKLNVY